jgi:hypothetical protein
MKDEIPPIQTVDCDRASFGSTTKFVTSFHPSAFILPKVGSPPALSPSPAGSLGIGQPRGWPILFPQTLQSVRKNRPVVCDLKYLANIRFGQRQTLIQDDSKLSA